MAQDKDIDTQGSPLAQHAAVPGDGTLRRMARAGVAEHQTKAMSLAKALRISVAKVADAELNLAMAVLALKVEARTGENIAEVLDDDALLILFEGSFQRRAGIVIDQAFVGSLIQQQTMGNVLADTSGEMRRMTATDAAICAPFLEALFTATAPLPEDEAERELLSGYQFGAQADSARLLDMALDAHAYQVISLTFDIANGARQGKVTLCLPESTAQMQALHVSDTDDVSTAALQSPTLKKTVLRLTTELNIALARLRMPLKQVSTLQVGQAIDIGTPSFEKARILTMAGRQLSSGVLGQLDGMRAVQVIPQAVKADHPRRRAGDVSPANLGPPLPQAEAALPTLPDVDVVPEAEIGDLMPPLPGEPDLPDLPDMSDLPELDA
ncbi:MAG: FliM/FliN family flagellar motor switch protein [Pseudomonadota bacterium]